MASVEEMKHELQELIERTRELHEKIEAQSAVDAVMVAAQTHRLDLASILLGSVGIILTVFGLVGFFEIRSKAKALAVETAKQECRSIAEGLLKDYTDDELPDEVRRLVESIAGDLILDGDAYGNQDTNQE